MVSVIEEMANILYNIINAVDIVIFHKGWEFFSGLCRTDGSVLMLWSDLSLEIKACSKRWCLRMGAFFFLV